MAKKKSSEKKSTKKGSRKKKTEEELPKEEPQMEEQSGATQEQPEEPVEEAVPVEEEPPKEEKKKKKSGKKSSKKKEEKGESAIDEDDEYAITLLGWATSGYDTSKLEDSLSKGDMKQFKRDYKKFEKGVARIEEMKREIEALNIAGVEKEVDELLELMKDPIHLKKAENYMARVKKLIYAKDLEAELDTMMSVTSLKERAEQLKEELKDPDNIDDVEEEMKDLRREFKEEYALNQFMELIDEKPREVKKIKVTEEVRKTSDPMVVMDLFAFTRNGRFIGHKTARKGELDKKDVIEKLNKAKEIISKENITPGMSLKIPAGEETLLVHKGEKLAVGLIISGVPHKLTGQLLKKGVILMETEDADTIAAWDGKKKLVLPHMKKNMNAILYAAMKLGEEMKK